MGVVTLGLFSSLKITNSSSFFKITNSSPLRITKSCAYAESNMGYIMSQTQKALEQNDINLIRLFAYRAINAFEKSKVQFKDCGCNDANSIIDKNNKNLKIAAKANSLSKAKILLNKSLKSTLKSIELFEKHQAHNNNNNNYKPDSLTFNTKKEKLILKSPVEKHLYTAIDQSLIKYETSLNEVVNTVNCKEAFAFANKIYSHCEQQLLISNLTEGKKYYNLRTKEITAKALKSIGDCKNN